MNNVYDGHVYLGKILIENGVINSQQLEDALKIQKETGRRLGDILISIGACSQEAIADALAVQMGLNRAPEGFWENPPDPSVKGEIARKYKFFPLKLENGKLHVAISDPLNITTIDESRYVTGYKIIPEIATQTEIDRAIRRWYGISSDESLGIEEGFDDEDAEEDNAEGPTVRAVIDIINGALSERASDIHIEPRKDATLVRYRIDGALRDIMRMPKKMHYSIVSRIKVMAGLDIADRRVPQDGRIKLREPHEIDLRVSTLPTTLGEAVVLRILDKSRVLPKLEVLGYEGEDLSRIRRAIGMPYGLVLLTGPTGSGKTTTLYAALSEVVTPSINVITVEDPPEYELEGIRQVAVNVKADLTFATALRSILRQDPDVVMIGEIRDSETAKIAVQAAMTGHLVLSTLHTNDVASAPARLVDMGVEPYLVASCLLCVVAQRLVRRVCHECAEPYQPPVDSPVWGFLNTNGTPAVSLKHGRGCPSCGRTGYRGRIAIVEVMTASREIRELIRQNSTADKIRDLAVRDGMTTLLENARSKALEGITTPEEAMRVASSFD
ncbi:Flp pilus assembly complex ATPase component TadA [Aceticella autotrophica]|uniref:Flp pilus assembly complex ATPase component TadA n=1 Tax=Aceticella autotrophica TaxID=2755338 RepID=A0A975GB03_9THEO|nr:GspE/PulE family protein [Aceticella autotrophica]QSZ28029.1 Flp pilus assembly complex ATPase component TadA [Aceticella autotrophica]